MLESKNQLHQADADVVASVKDAEDTPLSVLANSMPPKLSVESPASPELKRLSPKLSSTCPILVDAGETDPSSMKSEIVVDVDDDDILDMQPRCRTRAQHKKALAVKIETPLITPARTRARVKVKSVNKHHDFETPPEKRLKESIVPNDPKPCHDHEHEHANVGEAGNTTEACNAAFQALQKIVDVSDSGDTMVNDALALAQGFVSAAKEGATGWKVILKVFPILLDFAVVNQTASVELESKRSVKGRLESDGPFAQEYVSANCASSAAEDLRELSVAVKQGILLSDYLYHLKLCSERDLLLAALAKRIAELEAHVEVATKTASFAKQTIMGLANGKLAVRDLILPQIASLHESLANCSRFDGPEKDPDLFHRVQLLALKLLRMSAQPEQRQSDNILTDMGARTVPAELTKQVALAGSTGTALTEALLAVAKLVMEPQKVALETKLTRLKHDYACTSELAQSPAASVRDAEEKLKEDQGELMPLRQLLGRISDKEVRAGAIRELAVRARREAIEKLPKMEGDLTSVEAALNRCKDMEAPWGEVGYLLMSGGQPVAQGPASLSPRMLSDSDWARLEEGQQLNDMLIDLFIRLMVHAFGNQSVHAFTSHFYTRLCACGGNGGEGWENVKTWTRSARRLLPQGIFSCDFLFLPIHADNSHWLLAVVCRPWASGKVHHDGKLKSPIVVFFDSLGQNHTLQAQVVRVLQEYLAREWQDSIGSDYDEQLHGVNIEVPRQTNMVDCGIYVLEFAWQLLRTKESLEALGTVHPVLTLRENPRNFWQHAGAALRAATPEDTEDTKALAELLWNTEHHVTSVVGGSPDLPAPVPTTPKQQHTSVLKPFSPKRRSKAPDSALQCTEASP